MGKKNVKSSAWLNHYIETQVLNKVSPSERTRYRLARGHGDEAQAAWVSEVLPKYPALWSKMKNAERQRRFRSLASPTRWQKDWTVAKKVLGAENVRRLKACQEHLGDQQPLPLVTQAIESLLEHCRKEDGHAPLTVEWNSSRGDRGRKPPARAGELSKQSSSDKKPSDSEEDSRHASFGLRDPRD